MTPQPDRFLGPFKFDVYEGVEPYILVRVMFDGNDADAFNRAKEWMEEQIQIAAEINSWVDEELKDYPNG